MIIKWLEKKRKNVLDKFVPTLRKFHKPTYRMLKPDRSECNSSIRNTVYVTEWRWLLVTGLIKLKMRDWFRRSLKPESPNYFVDTFLMMVTLSIISDNNSYLYITKPRLDDSSLAGGIRIQTWLRLT
jgi:hypothetical protein